MLDERRRKAFDRLVWSVSLAFAAVFPLAAGAGGARAVDDSPTYRAECGGCHVAYPPALLGRDAWRTIMNSLDRHFGTDASVDAPMRTELTAWLDARAGTRHTGGATRITETSGFRREHGEIAAAIWSSKAVKSASNCEACHRGAAAGDYSERSVRIPRGGAR